MRGRVQQFLAVFSATLSAVSDGMHYAWTAPIIPLLQHSNSTLQVTHTDVLWLENVYMIGGFAGIPFTVLTIDRFGRKTSIIVGAVQSVVSWILIGVGPSIEYVYVARFLSGLAGDVGFVAAPMYVAEIADKKIRGFLGSWIYLMMLVGIVIIYSVGPFVTLAVSSAVGCAFLVVELLTFPFMPESPYYHVMKKNPAAARKSLQRLRSTDDVQEEMEEIAATVKMQLSQGRGCGDLVMKKNSRKALLIMTVLNLAQHFSGYSVILMNIHSILEDASGSLSVNNIAIWYSVLMLVSALLSSFIVDKAGRKILLGASSITTGISVLVFAIYMTLKESNVDLTSYSWVPTFFVMSFAICFKFGLGIVPIVTTGELFPTDLKALGMTTADGIYIVSSILSIYVYQVLKENFGHHVPFFLFSACCVCTTIFTVFFIPETKGKTLKEIQIMLNGLPSLKDSSEAEEKLNAPEKA